MITVYAIKNISLKINQSFLDMVICTKIRVHKIQVSITILSMRNITLTCVYMYMHVVELVQPVYIVIYDIHYRWCTMRIQPQYQFSFLLPPPPAITSDLAVVPFWWTPFSVGITYLKKKLKLLYDVR